MNRHRINLLLACYSFFTLLPSLAMAADAATRDFLSRHWQRPLQHQGEPPAAFSDLEAALDARACGSCHPQQFQDWQASLHAHAMGPGLLGQLMELDPADRDELQACLRCHAPLAEQADEVVAWLSHGATSADGPSGEGILNGPLYTQGLLCAGCHLRNYQVYGPERNPALPPRLAARESAYLPHNGWQTQNAFADSRFCSACHQFAAEGYALNGKLLENTFEEWKASPQGKAGESCQSCHMPGRRHLWRGIHDKASVQSGVTIMLQEVTISDEKVSGILTLSNTGVGHRFPTYVTPRVVMEAVQQDRFNNPISATRQEQVIARQVSLDLNQELFDTRLAPGETARLVYQAPLHPAAKKIQFRIQVEPDVFYRDFYRAVLNNGSSDKGAAIIRLALKQAEASVYTLFFKEIPFNLRPGP